MCKIKFKPTEEDLQNWNKIKIQAPGACDESLDFSMFGLLKYYQ